jgi:hypothetical protein
LPAGLHAGDTLSPSATVTSEDGTPAQGVLAEVWYFNGSQANSITWDGRPVNILLQLSCQGHAQEIQEAALGLMDYFLGKGFIRGFQSIPG